jgi:hypothetical protein
MDPLNDFFEDLELLLLQHCDLGKGEQRSERARVLFLPGGEEVERD